MSPNVIRAVVYYTFGVAAALYTLQVLTPLRLTMDGITYLSFADSAVRSGFWETMRQPGFPFPKGYPIFIFALMKLGVFSAATLVIANLLLFALGLFFAFRVLLALNFNRVHAQIAVLFLALAFAAVKFTTQGMSDFLFFALSSCVCWLLTIEHPYRWFGIAICTAAAVEVRFAGLALIVPILVVAWLILRKKPLTALIVSGLMGSVTMPGLVAGHKYLLLNHHNLQTAGLWHFAENTPLAHFQDFGDITVNAPISKLPSYARGPFYLLDASPCCSF